MSGLLVVCVGGPSGSGKTSFCKRLLELLAGSTQLSLSNYIDVDMAELAGGNIDDPRATDFSLLLRNLSELRAGRDTLAPVYDFKQRARNGWTKVSPPANGVLIVEGVYALNAVVRTMSDLCVSISGGVHFDLVKRIKRDCMLSAGGTVSDDDEAAAAAAAAAGGDGGQLLQNISETVFPFFKAFVEPDLQLAHVRVTNAHNPFSGFLDQAQYSLKSDKAVSTQDIEAYMEGYAQRKRHVNKRLSSVGSVTEVEAAGTLDMDGEIATSPSSASEEQQRELLAQLETAQSDARAAVRSRTHTREWARGSGAGRWASAGLACLVRPWGGGAAAWGGASGPSPGPPVGRRRCRGRAPSCA